MKRGLSPQTSHGTVRKSLLSYGSYHSTIRIQVAPMSKQFWLSLSYSAEPFFCSASSTTKVLILTHYPFNQSRSMHCSVPFIADELNFPK